MRKSIISWIFFIFLLGVTQISLSFAEVDNAIGSYLFKDNSSFDKNGNSITLTDALTSHGWLYQADLTTSPSDGGSYETFGGDAVIHLDTSSAYISNFTNTVDKTVNVANTYSVSLLWSRQAGTTNRDIYFYFSNLSKTNAQVVYAGIRWRPDQPDFSWATSGTGMCAFGTYIGLSLNNDDDQVYNLTLTVNKDTNTIGCVFNRTTCATNCSLGTGNGFTGIVIQNSDVGSIGEFDNIRVYNGTELPQEYVEPDPIPPQINDSSYNLTSGGGAGCINWRTNKSNPCSTGDPTPTVNFTTNEIASCAIGTQNINFSDYNALGINRNCTLGQETTIHTCILTLNDELVYENSEVYIACKDASGNENLTSTSGALKLNVTDLEALGRNSIELGIRNSLSSGYTIYTDQKIYARNSANNQSVGAFDKVVKKLNKIWAFNRIGISDSHVNMFNVTPVLYTLEFANKTSTYIENQTSLLINATK